MKIIFLTVINSLLMASGQMLWKKGMMGLQITGIFDMISVLFTPFIFSGLIVYGFTTLLWLYILNKAEISYVYPIQSVVFIFVLVGSIIIFKETVSFNRWLGVLIICFGVYIVSIK